MTALAASSTPENARSVHASPHYRDIYGRRRCEAPGYGPRSIAFRLAVGEFRCGATTQRGQPCQARASYFLADAFYCGRHHPDAVAEAAEQAAAGWGRLSLAEKKRAARSKVGDAVWFGTLVRQPCEVGEGCRGAVHGHHDDYDKPLEVRWLCVRHHVAHHERERRLRRGRP